MNVALGVASPRPPPPPLIPNKPQYNNDLLRFSRPDKSKPPSPLLTLPAELRNNIYELLASTAPKCYIPHHPYPTSTPPNPALALASTCRQLHSEIGLLPYSCLRIHVLKSTSFKTWLKNRTPEQRKVITQVNVLCVIIMDGIRDSDELDFYTSPKRDSSWMNKLPRLQSVHVLMQPYQRVVTISSSSLAEKAALWEKRAQICAEAFVTVPTSTMPAVSGNWMDPVSDEAQRRAIEEKMRDDGFVFSDLLGRWSRSEGWCVCTRAGGRCSVCLEREREGNDDGSEEEEEEGGDGDVAEIRI